MAAASGGSAIAGAQGAQRQAGMGRVVQVNMAVKHVINSQGAQIYVGLASNITFLNKPLFQFFIQIDPPQGEQWDCTYITGIATPALFRVVNLYNDITSSDANQQFVAFIGTAQATNVSNVVSIALPTTNYGNGSDGAVTFDGTTTYPAFATLVSTTYTLTRDIQSTSIVISSGITVNTANFRMLSQGSFTNNGTVLADSLGGAGGAALVLATQTVVTSAGNPGAQVIAPNGILTGGGGGSGGGNTNTGGSAGSITSGAGGIGGGMIWIAANILLNNGTLTAKGGNAVNGSHTGANVGTVGGGGGGGGGYILLTYHTKLEQGVTVVTGGNGSSGANGGGSSNVSNDVGGNGANGYGAGGIGATGGTGAAGSNGNSGGGGAGGADDTAGGRAGGAGGNGAVQTLLV